MFLYKKCPKGDCHTPNLGSNNFCTSCGEDLRNVLPIRSCFVIANNKGPYFTEKSKRYDSLDILRNKHDLKDFPRWQIFLCFDEDIDSGEYFRPISAYIVNDLGEPLMVDQPKPPIQFKPSI